MPKSLLKMASALAILVVCATALTGCESKLERELREMEETHNILSELARDFGYELPEFGDTSGVVTEIPDEQSKYGDTKQGYTLFPSEIFMDANVNLKRYSGNRYYVPAIAGDKGFLDDGTEYMLPVMFHEDIVEVNDSLALTIISTQSQPGWSDTRADEIYMFYFEYLGYDEARQKHIGKYVSHEPFELWW